MFVPVSFEFMLEPYESFFSTNPDMGDSDYKCTQFAGTQKARL